MGRVIHKFLVWGPGVHFGSWEGAHGWGVCIAVWHSDCNQHVWGQVSGLCTLLSQELQAVSCRCANETISGREILARRGSGLCDPIEEQDLGHITSTSGLFPHPWPGFYKRRCVEPLTLFCATFSARLGSALAAPHCLCPSLALHSQLVCD